MIEIYWNLAEESQLSVGAAESFLSADEILQFKRMRFPKRRREWLLGRYAAKRLLATVLQPDPPAVLEVHNGPSGAPQVWLNGIQRSDLCLSISHSGSATFCALSTDPSFHAGADLEKIEPRPENFVLDYFSSGELAWFHSLEGEFKATGATLLWSAKESMLKALGVGLHLDTRQVEIQSVEMPGSGSEWNTLRVSGQDLKWQAWWRKWGEYVLTLAVCSDVGNGDKPILLKQVD